MLLLINIIEKKIKTFGTIALFIIIGTCNITSKEGRFIGLKHGDPVSSLKQTYANIQDLCSKYSSVKLTFHHMPYYSIEKWSGLKGHPDTASFGPCHEKIEISPVASLHMILSKKGITKALIRQVCTCVVRKPPKTGFFCVALERSVKYFTGGLKSVSQRQPCP